jgi:hypothetical protein
MFYMVHPAQTKIYKSLYIFHFQLEDLLEDLQFVSIRFLLMVSMMICEIRCRSSVQF